MLVKLRPTNRIKLTFTEIQNITCVCSHITLFKLMFFLFLPKYIFPKVSNNFEVFMAKYLRPNSGSRAGSWVRYRADQVGNPDPDG